MRIVDLSHNRITASVSEYGLNVTASVVQGTELKLIVNRLSGDLPLHLDCVDNLEVLVGNNFDCRTVDDLPKNDANHEKTTCASGDLDQSMYFLCGVIVLWIVLVFVADYSLRQQESSLFQGSSMLSVSSEEIMDKLKPFQSLQRVITVSKSLMRLCVICSVVITVVCTPLYAALKAGGSYATHEYQYRWYVTAAKLSGLVPALIILVIWTLFIVYLFVHFVFGGWGADSPSRNFLSVGPSNPFSLEKNVLRKRAVAYFFVINAVFSVSLNGIYIYFVMNKVQYAVLVILQLSMAFARLCWKKVLAFVLSDEMYAETAVSTKVLFMTWACILNDVMLPALAALFVDASCFLDFIIPPSEITSSYTVEDCFEYYVNSTSGFGCVMGSRTYSTSYLPTFVYNFQCGSAVLQTFVPVILFSCGLSSIYSLIIFLLAKTRVRICRYVPKFLLPAFPPLLYARDEDDTLALSPSSSSQSRQAMSGLALFKVHDVLAFNIQQLALIISFGLCAPYVALAIGLSVYFNWLKLLAVFSKQLSVKDSLDGSTDHGMFESIDSACENIAKLRYRRIWLMIAANSCLLIGFFLVDMAADEDHVSLTNAGFLLLACVVVVVILWVYSAYWTHVTSATTPTAALPNKQYGRNPSALSSSGENFGGRGISTDHNEL